MNKRFDWSIGDEDCAIVITSFTKGSKGTRMEPPTPDEVEYDICLPGMSTRSEILTEAATKEDHDKIYEKACQVMRSKE